MNLFDTTLELDDYREDFLGLHEPDFSIEPEWYMEQDLTSNCID